MLKVVLRELMGIAGEDKMPENNKGPALFFVSSMYDSVVNLIKRGLIIDGNYEVIKQTSITGEDIKKMTQESANGKIFYVFDISSINPFSMQYKDINFVIAHSLIIIMGGKRYLVIEKGKKRVDVQSTDFNLIERENVSGLIESNTLIGGGIK